MGGEGIGKILRTDFPQTTAKAIFHKRSRKTLANLWTSVVFTDVWDEQL